MSHEYEPIESELLDELQASLVTGPTREQARRIMGELRRSEAERERLQAERDNDTRGRIAMRTALLEEIRELNARAESAEAQLKMVRDLLPGEEHIATSDPDYTPPDFHVSVDSLVEALIWCSGSGDFAPGGTAREGWEKGPAKLLAEWRKLRDDDRERASAWLDANWPPHRLWSGAVLDSLVALLRRRS